MGFEYYSDPMVGNKTLLDEIQISDRCDVTRNIAVSLSKVIMKNLLLNHTKRRSFLKRLWILTSIIPVYNLIKMIKKRLEYLTKSKTKLKFDMDFPQGITIKDELIIYRKTNEYKIFSNRCSHLGCKITNIEGRNLVCPCHGSRYSLIGEVLQGPAKQNLKPINFRIDLKNRMIIIENS